jgi:hypothetical protein
MTKQGKTTLKMAIVCSFVLLAVAVFAWGLHAKLALYGPHIAPSSNTVAKLLPGQRSSQTLLSAPQMSRSRSPWQVVYTLFAALLLLLSRQVWRTDCEPEQIPALSPQYRQRLFSRPPPMRFRSR